MSDIAAEIAIETAALTKRYAGLAVVREVSVRLPQGSKTALLGANGAGKTTLLGMLTTLITPSDGEAHIAGFRLAGNVPAMRRRIGVLTHSPMLYEELTPLENLTFFARLYGVEQREARCEELLRRLGLWLRRHEPVAVLSRGYHQRLALARALVHRPDVLLLDEPETGLDGEAVALLDELVLRAPGLTVFAATHRHDRIGEWATGTVTLERGAVVEDTASLAAEQTAGDDAASPEPAWSAT